MTKEEIESELKSLQERSKVLEEQLKQINENKSEKQISDSRDNRSGLGGNHGGGRTARPDRGKPYRW